MLDLKAYCKSYCKCSNCGSNAEVDTTVVLTSLPPRYRYHCSCCGYDGFTTNTSNSYSIAVDEKPDVELDDTILGLVKRVAELEKRLEELENNK